MFYWVFTDIYYDACVEVYHTNLFGYQKHIFRDKRIKHHMCVHSILWQNTHITLIKTYIFCK